MKHLVSKDLGIIFLLTTIYIIIISFPNFNFKYQLDLIFFIFSFLFTGYSIISLLRPEEDYRDILHKPVLILEFSVLLSLAVSVLLRFSSLGLHLKSLVMVLSIIIMVLSVSAYIRRINYFKSHEKKVRTPKPQKKSFPKQKIASKRFWYYDIILIDVLSVFVLISYFISVLNLSIIHNTVGLLYMLFLSGYMLVYIIIPIKNDVDTKIRIGLSFGFSLPITSLIGLPLHFTKYGISTSNILFLLAILTLILSMFAYIRRSNADNLLLNQKT
jgi:uncharacterized membrane protein